jgi:uncharacterized protein (TIGR01777 family)
MKVAVSGARGFIGQAFTELLRAEGHEVIEVRRTPKGFGWAVIEGADAVVHLAGRNIAARWTATFKRTMLAERAAAVQSLQAALKNMSNPPKVVVIASAIGHYGETRQMAAETAPRGTCFPAQICEVVEAGAYPKNIRVVQARIGVVLGKGGGALAKMLPAFYLGLGGPVGVGQQMLSWVSRTDVARALLHCVENPKLQGPVNLVAPHPIPQAELAATLGRVLQRPAFLTMPAFMVKILFGEMGEELLLKSCLVSSAKLQQSGFVFQQPTLEMALRAELT